MSVQVGIVLVADEGLLRHTVDALGAWVDDRPRWSDLPFMMLTSDREAASIGRQRQQQIGQSRDVTLIERPVTRNRPSRDQAITENPRGASSRSAIKPSDSSFEFVSAIWR